VILLTTFQVAEQLAISQQRVRALIASGELKAQKMGGVWIIEDKAIEALRHKMPSEGSSYRGARLKKRPPR
jgi:excisionase family DNA binding protein